MGTMEPEDRCGPTRQRRGSRALRAGVAALALTLAPAAAASAASCPVGINTADFASAAQLQKLTAKFNSFGPRILGSGAHNKAIGWLEDQAKDIDGFRVRSDRYGVYRWLPGTKFAKQPGLDIGAAGGISVTRADGSKLDVPDAGAVRFSKPTTAGGQGGPLAYLPADQAITAENAAGKVIIRDFPPGSIPFGALRSLVGLFVTPDLDGVNDYTRPYIDTHEKDLIAAGQAGAAGVIFSFDVPQEEVRGYYDPHTGTIQRQPAVYVGYQQANELKALATQGASASLSVNAAISKTTSRNLIATLPGKSKEKIVLAANTDGNTWVQEDGVLGMLALARSYAKLSKKCRPRTLELVFATSHDATTTDGVDRYSAKLDPKKVAFAFTIEHLGTREILPTGDGANRHLTFTGQGDPFLFGAGDSDVLRKTAEKVTKGRKLSRTAVLKGLGVPDAQRVPPICSMGGLGSSFHSRLIPTLAMISGPWSLYDPVFGAKAIDFKRMRTQVLAAGDALLALDGLSYKKLAGDYLGFREKAKAGAKNCPRTPDPQFAPGPGEYSVPAS